VARRWPRWRRADRRFLEIEMDKVGKGITVGT
jgi:hypothetical protein